MEYFRDPEGRVMIDIIKARERRYSDFGWLKTYWLFSFADYYDPGNIQFGPLRVFNDDIVEPGTGFPTHPHDEMEIITVVLDGEMTHEDSMGNKTVIAAGDVQRMSAGTGITHSEFNLSRGPVHFYQIWLYPEVPLLAPSYDQMHFESADFHNTFFPVASGQGLEGVVSFHTDATVYRAAIDAGKVLEYRTREDRRIFVYLTEGTIEINNVRLQKHDQARIDMETVLKFDVCKPCELVLIDIPSCRGWGYSRDTLKGERRSR